jgi:hypothetical protein
MEAIFVHSIFLLCMGGMFLLGRLLARNPDAVLRFTSAAAFPSMLKAGRGYIRFVGKFFQVMSCLGALLYLGAIIYDIFHLR